MGEAATGAAPAGVGAATVEDIAQGGDRDAWATGAWSAAFSAISRSMSYRDGWYTLDGDPQILFAMGVYGQNLFLDVQNRIVIAKLSSWAEPIDNRALGLTHMMVGAIRRHLLEQA